MAGPREKGQMLFTNPILQPLRELIELLNKEYVSREALKITSSDLKG